MPKPILKTQQKQNNELKTGVKTFMTQKVDSMTMDKRLRQKRSNEYIESIKQLDIGGQNLNKEHFNKFIEAIENEFPDVPFEAKLVGIISKCYLGHPYEVHSLDLAGNIITHYKLHESMPALMERGRALAIHEVYEFIEVYTDSLRAVKEDGTVSVVKL